MKTTVVMTLVSTSTDSETGETHHEVEVRAAEFLAETEVQALAEEGLGAALKVLHDKAEPPSVTAEREQDFESGSQQEG